MVAFTVVNVFTCGIRLQHSVPSQLLLPELCAVLSYLIGRNYLTLHYAIFKIEKKFDKISKFVKAYKKSEPNEEKYFGNGKKLGIYRSSPPEVFLRKGALKIYSKFTGEHP